eukprot:TRINITY_DN1329_c2_g2_i1.p1 TRINITY_DN1329_c2_g2~~TRINITY_DN1329_c2_g2_i1.p1  ORF type:complete len:221 (-),score=96.12 TRINITY_DN1329_c2_g2_i1:417-1079(-)
MRAEVDRMSKRLEDVMILLTQVEDAARPRLMLELRDLSSHARAHIAECRAAPHLTLFVAELENIVGNVRQLLGTLQQMEMNAAAERRASAAASSSSSAQAIEEGRVQRDLEERFFAVLERSSSCDEAELPAVHEQLQELQKEMTAYRHAVNKEVRDENLRKRLDDRVADLQENLTDLRHVFGKRYDASSFGTATASRIVEGQVRAAQKNMQQLEDDMFDL